MTALVAILGRFLSRIGAALTRGGHVLQVWAWRGGTFQYKVTFVNKTGKDIPAGTLLAYRPDGTVGPAVPAQGWNGMGATVEATGAPGMPMTVSPIVEPVDYIALNPGMGGASSGFVAPMVNTGVGGSPHPAFPRIDPGVGGMVEIADVAPGESGTKSTTEPGVSIAFGPSTVKRRIYRSVDSKGTRWDKDGTP